jgi:hypothetical protein
VAATEAAGTARVRRRRFSAPPREPDLAASAEEGVTEFARRRTRTATTDMSGMKAALAHVPWLGRWLGEYEPDEASWSAYVGTAQYFATEDVATMMGEGDPDAPRRGPMDPVWILDALRVADEAWPAGDGRLAFSVDPGAHRDAIEAPAHRPQTRPSRITGEATLDASGRIREVTWRSIPRVRRRGPFAQRRDFDLWTTTELWDFGLPVEIELPQTRTRRE